MGKRELGYENVGLQPRVTTHVLADLKATSETSIAVAILLRRIR